MTGFLGEQQKQIIMNVDQIIEAIKTLTPLLDMSSMNHTKEGVSFTKMLTEKLEKLINKLTP